MSLRSRGNASLPHTALWVGDPTALQDPIGNEGIELLAHPVIIRGEPQAAYELADLARWHAEKGNSPLTRTPFLLEEVEPVRYPGFQGYAATQALMQAHPHWIPYVDPPGEPSLADGMAMPNPFNAMPPPPPPAEVMQRARLDAAARAAAYKDQRDKTQAALQADADRQWLRRFRDWQRYQLPPEHDEGQTLEEARDDARAAFVSGMHTVAAVPAGDPRLQAKLDLLTRIATHFFNHHLEPPCVPRPESATTATNEIVGCARQLGAWGGAAAGRMLELCRRYQDCAKRGQACLAPELARGAPPPTAATITRAMYRRMALAYWAAPEII